MSDVAEKAFEPTPRRIAKAKREGNIARSSELAANVSFAAGCFAVLSVAPTVRLRRCKRVRSFAIVAPAPSCVLVAAVALIPIAAASTAGAIASVAQSGGLALVPVTAKIERLNPVEGIRRILSRETLSHSLRAALAFLCATLAMTPASNGRRRGDDPRGPRADVDRGVVCGATRSLCGRCGRPALFGCGVWRGPFVVAAKVAHEF